MRPTCEPARIAATAGAAALNVDNTKQAHEHCDPSLFAEPWAARHNAELWGDYIAAERKMNSQK